MRHRDAVLFVSLAAAALAGCSGAQTSGHGAGGDEIPGGGTTADGAIVIDAEITEGGPPGAHDSGEDDTVASSGATEAAPEPEVVDARVSEAAPPAPTAAGAPTSGTKVVSVPPVPGTAHRPGAATARELERAAPTRGPRRDVSRVMARSGGGGGEGRAASRSHRRRRAPSKSAPRARRPASRPRPTPSAPPADAPMFDDSLDMSGAVSPSAESAGESMAPPPAPTRSRRRSRAAPPRPSSAPSGGAASGSYGRVMADEDGRDAAGGALVEAPGREAYVAAQVSRRLTAGTVADVDRRADYHAYLTRHPGEAAQLGLDMSRRVRFRVVDSAGRPVHDAGLTLVGQSGVHVAGRTHADGFWDFFPNVSAPHAAGGLTLFIQTGSLTAQAPVMIPAQGDGRDVVIRLPRPLASAPRTLDLAFLIDVTGSMGDELAYVNAEVMGIVERVRAAVPATNVRVAATFYRDRGDAVPVEQIPFSSDVRAFMSRMSYVQATGGGDYPEDLNTGLAAALTTLDWTATSATRVLVVIADAPPQQYPDFQWSHHQAMAYASERGIRILPVAASGANRVVEYLFRAMGSFTSTPYVYLTDDSGIGGRHMEADTERVSIEMFSDCLTRLLISDLRGQGMHEASYAPTGIVLPRQ